MKKIVKQRFIVHTKRFRLDIKWLGSTYLKTVGWRIIVKYDMGSLGGDDLAGSRGVEEGADKGLARTYLLFLEWLPRD